MLSVASSSFETPLTVNVVYQLILIMISCIGWVANHFTSLKFVSQNDISAAVG